MDNTFILEYLGNSGMINIEEGLNIYHLLCKVIELNIEGDIVECGCSIGYTALIMQRVIQETNSRKNLYLFDSFKGLPAKNEKDGLTSFVEGSMIISKEVVIKNFQNYNLNQPIIIEGWFKDILPEHLPKKICFAHLDGDFYSSIKESLEYVYPQLSSGAIVVIDDYYDSEIHSKIVELTNQNTYSKISSRNIQINNYLQGVKTACDEFFADKPEKVFVMIAGEEKQGYFVKI